MSDAELFVVGLSHHTAPVEIRETLSVATAELASALAELRASGLSDAVLLSTCNRVEIYGASTQPSHAIEAARRFLSSKSDVSLSDLLYTRTGHDAVTYCFRVASSLDSMVVGEPQILGQVKQAVSAAEQSGHLGPLLRNFFQRAFATAKRVRHETSIAEGTVSISSIAVDLTTQIFGELKGKRALLVGAGEMAESAAALLSKQGAALTVINRSPERAERLAATCGGTHRSWSELEFLLSKVDVCVTSTAANESIIRYDSMKQITRQRRGRPLFLVDIAVPRDVEPRVGDLANIYLYDVDDLNAVARENRQQREEAAKVAAQLIDEAASEFSQWKRNLVLGPTVVALRDGFRRIVDEEVARAQAKHGSSTRLQPEVLEAMSHRIVNKLLHAPLTELKRPEPDRDALIVALQRLFALEVDPDRRSESLMPTAKSDKDDIPLRARSASEGSS